MEREKVKIRIYEAGAGVKGWFWAQVCGDPDERLPPGVLAWLWC